MSEEVGSAHIEVSADTTPFRAQMKALKATGKKLGKQVGDATFREVAKSAREQTSRMNAAVQLNVLRAERRFASFGNSVGKSMSRANAAVQLNILRSEERFAGLRRVVGDAMRKFSGDLNSGLLTAKLFGSVVPREIRDVGQSSKVWLGTVGEREASRFHEALSQARVSGRLFGIYLKRDLKSVGRSVLTNIKGISIPEFRGFRRAVSISTAVVRGDLARLSRDKSLSRFSRNVLAKTLIIRKDMLGLAKTILDPRTSLRLLNISAKTVGRAFQRTMQSIARKIQTSWLRMDSTVRLVIISILIAAQPLAVVFSGLSASLVALTAAAAGAFAAFAALGGIIPAFAYGIGLAVAGLKDLEKFSPEAAAAVANLKDAFSNVDVPAFMREWTPALTDFLDVLANNLRFDTLAASIGSAFGRITEAFTELISGDVFAGFIDTLEGPLSIALGNIGSALAPMIEALLSFFTAASPYAVELSNMFLSWAENLAAVWAGVGESQAFHDFMRLAVSAVENIFIVLGQVKDILSTVFQAGIGPGNIFLGMIQNILADFSNFLDSVEGQDALQTFFSRILDVMPPLFDLIGAVGQALASLITPEVVDGVGSFLGALASIMPVLGEILSILGEARIVELFAEAINLIGIFLGPLAGPLKTFISALSDGLFAAMTTIEPLMAEFGAILGDILIALLPIIPPLLDLGVKVLAAIIPLLPVFITLAELIAGLVPILVDALMPLLDPLAELFTTVAEVLDEAVVPMFEMMLPLLLPLIKIGLIPLLALIELLNPVLELLGGIIQIVTMLLSPLIEKIVDWIDENEVVKKVVDKISDAMDVLSGWIETVINWFKDWINDVQIGDWWDETWGKLKSGFEDVKEGIAIVGDAIKNAFKNGLNGVIDIWNNTVGKLSWSVPDWIPLIGGKTFSAPKFARFASGGIAYNATPGVFGEDGREALVPLDRPLSRVSPDVRWLSAIAQGKGDVSTNNSRSVTIAQGAIVATLPNTDPEMAAAALLDRIVARAS